MRRYCFFLVTLHHAIILKNAYENRKTYLAHLDALFSCIRVILIFLGIFISSHLQPFATVVNLSLLRTLEVISMSRRIHAAAQMRYWNRATYSSVKKLRNFSRHSSRAHPPRKLESGFTVIPPRIRGILSAYVRFGRHKWNPASVHLLPARYRSQHNAILTFDLPMKLSFRVGSL